MIGAAMAAAGLGAEEVYSKMSSSDLSTWKKVTPPLPRKVKAQGQDGR